MLIERLNVTPLCAKSVWKKAEAQRFPCGSREWEKCRSETETVVMITTTVHKTKNIQEPSKMFMRNIWVNHRTSWVILWNTTEITRAHWYATGKYVLNVDDPLPIL